MVSCDRGYVQIKGTRIDLITDLACIIHSMVNDGVIEKDMLFDLIEDACMSEEELRVEAKKAEENIANMLVGQMVKLFGEGYTKDDVLRIIRSVKEKK